MDPTTTNGSTNASTSPEQFYLSSLSWWTKAPLYLISGLAVMVVGSSAWHAWRWYRFRSLQRRKLDSAAAAATAGASGAGGRLVSLLGDATRQLFVSIFEEPTSGHEPAPPDPPQHHETDNDDGSDDEDEDDDDDDADDDGEDDDEEDEDADYDVCDASSQSGSGGGGGEGEEKEGGSDEDDDEEEEEEDGLVGRQRRKKTRKAASGEPSSDGSVSAQTSTPSKSVFISSQSAFANVSPGGSVRLLPQLTIVILSGCCSLSREWWHFQELLVQGAISVLEQKYSCVRCVSYDRAGYLLSSKGSASPAAVCNDLDALLGSLGVGPSSPLVLLAHSLGGQYAEYYVRTRPSRVTGVLLLDAYPSEALLERELKAAGSTLRLSAFRSQKVAFGWLARFGLLRLSGFVPYAVPPDVLPYAREHFASGSDIFQSVKEVDELEKVFDAAGTMEGLGIFPSVALSVIYHDPAKTVEQMVADGMPPAHANELEAALHSLVRKQLGLSIYSSWHVLAGSGHNMHLDQPEALAKLVLSELLRC